MRPLPLLLAALAAAATPGCIIAETDRVHVSHGHGGRAVVVEHEYVYFPAYHAYYCEANDGWWVRDGAGWVRTSRPPAAISISADVSWVNVRVAGDQPFVKFDEHCREYPDDWRPSRGKGPPPGRGWRK